MTMPLWAFGSSLPSADIDDDTMLVTGTFQCPCGPVAYSDLPVESCSYDHCTTRRLDRTSRAGVGAGFDRRDSVARASVYASRVGSDADEGDSSAALGALRETCPYEVVEAECPCGAVGVAQARHPPSMCVPSPGFNLRSGSNSRRGRISNHVPRCTKR